MTRLVINPTNHFLRREIKFEAELPLVEADPEINVCDSTSSFPPFHFVCMRLSHPLYIHNTGIHIGKLFLQSRLRHLFDIERHSKMTLATTARKRNEARKDALAGRPCLRRYRKNSDEDGFVDKRTFQRIYEEKWAGAPWMEEYEKNDNDVLFLDNAPATSPASSASASPTSSPSSSPPNSRQSTLEDE